MRGGKKKRCNHRAHKVHNSRGAIYRALRGEVTENKDFCSRKERKGFVEATLCGCPFECAAHNVFNEAPVMGTGSFLKYKKQPVPESSLRGEKLYQVAAR
jgi:hypothetical protein